MSFEVVASDNFSRESKRLARKYRSLKSELGMLYEQLIEQPTLGSPLGNDVFKIRLGIKSKGKGKSGGRVITYVQIDSTRVVLLSIYDKGEKDSISDSEIIELIKRYQ